MQGMSIHCTFFFNQRRQNEVQMNRGSHHNTAPKLVCTKCIYKHRNLIRKTNSTLTILSRKRDTFGCVGDTAPRRRRLTSRNDDAVRDVMGTRPVPDEGRVDGPRSDEGATELGGGEEVVQEKEEEEETTTYLWLNV
jgi:hypothetical protein